MACGFAELFEAFNDRAYKDARLGQALAHFEVFAAAEWALYRALWNPWIGLLFAREDLDLPLVAAGPTLKSHGSH